MDKKLIITKTAINIHYIPGAVPDPCLLYGQESLTIDTLLKYYYLLNRTKKNG